MQDLFTRDYGARVERGVVTGADANGYTVLSISRPGLKTPALSALNGSTYSVGDGVYFFMFDDGKGAILMDAG